MWTKLHYRSDCASLEITSKLAIKSAQLNVLFYAILTARQFPNGTFFGRHPLVARASVEHHVEVLAGGAEVDGSVVLGVQVVGEVQLGEGGRFDSIAPCDGLHRPLNILGGLCRVQSVQGNSGGSVEIDLVMSYVKCCHVVCTCSWNLKRH